MTSFPHLDMYRTLSYVGTSSKMTYFVHPYLGAHILTHSSSTFGCHTFFFHIYCNQIFSTIIVGGRHFWGRLGNSSISIMPPAYSCLHCDESVLNNGPGCWRVTHEYTIHSMKIRRDLVSIRRHVLPQLAHAHSTLEQWIMRYNLPTGYLKLHFTVVSFCGVWRHSSFCGWSNIAIMMKVQHKNWSSSFCTVDIFLSIFNYWYW